MLRPLGTRALQASWNSSEGAAWLHLVLTDLLGGSSLTAVVTRGVSNHTFLHLSPGTAYELTLSATAGPHRAVGPSATECTCESLGVGEGHSRECSVLLLWPSSREPLAGALGVVEAWGMRPWCWLVVGALLRRRQWSNSCHQLNPSGVGSVLGTFCVWFH